MEHEPTNVNEKTPFPDEPISWQEEKAKSKVELTDEELEALDKKEIDDHLYGRR